MRLARTEPVAFLNSRKAVEKCIDVAAGKKLVWSKLFSRAAGETREWRLELQPCRLSIRHRRKNKDRGGTKGEGKEKRAVER